MRYEPAAVTHELYVPTGHSQNVWIYRKTLRGCVVSFLPSNNSALNSSPIDDSSELWRLERAAATTTALSQPQEALDLRADH